MGFSQAVRRLSIRLFLSYPKPEVEQTIEPTAGHLPVRQYNFCLAFEFRMVAGPSLKLQSYSPSISIS